MAPWPAFVAAGCLIGILTGLFGVGGSSVATPLLSVLGVPGLLAVASPLPATIPSAILASIPYLARHEARFRTAGWSLLSGVPATVIGALLSEVVGGSLLLLASGAVLAVLGLRVMRPLSDSAVSKGGARRQDRALLVATMFVVGVFSGLLANGGGFLLIPLYLLVFGLGMREATGTSLVVIAVLTVPTLATHWALGHIDWKVALAFLAGAAPTSYFSSRLAHHMRSATIQKSFGLFLVASGAAFVAFRLVH